MGTTGGDVISNEVHVLQDEGGMAVIGEASAVESFLASRGLASRELPLDRLRPALATAAGVAQTASTAMAESGRWVKATKQSAEAMKHLELMKGSAPGVSRAVLTDKGKAKQFLEIVRTPGSMLTNPALLAGAAGIMAQARHAADDGRDHGLPRVDRRKARRRAARAQRSGARRHGRRRPGDRGGDDRPRARRSGVRGDLVQGPGDGVDDRPDAGVRPAALDALADDLERHTAVGDLAKTTAQAQVSVQEWLAVLARCFQAQDALAVLEIDRVLDGSPEEVDRHRTGLQAARHHRLDLITRTTERLMVRLDAAARAANAKVLLHPAASRSVVSASNHVAGAVVAFHEPLGIDGDRQSVDARRWVEAAADARDRVRETGAGGYEAAKQARRSDPWSCGLSGRSAVKRRRRACPPPARQERRLSEAVTREGPVRVDRALVVWCAIRDSNPEPAD
ncbi:hypothetical protein GCM10025868_10930 [Angustibacter aerolatus]|uniref:DUF222 domain-containing protein n=1 Tax=Angustibacter aerolatus TaxID=1162965 RepID=A0ABQ6JCF6_9ACTN|nr:hypothetical protein GCM10025868_10930 [Angustibacter aerolatus]